MFGKLVKNEFKQSVRSVAVIYIIVAVLAAALLIAFAAGAMWIRTIGGVLLFISGIAMLMMTVVAVIKNFSESLYGRQGYLSFTLPVKCSSLLASKVIVSVIWVLCSLAIMGIIYLLLFVTATSTGVDSFGRIKELIESLGLAEILPSKLVVAEVLISLVVIVLLNIIVLVGFVFFSITVANTRALQKKPGFFGILTFLATYIITNAVSAPITQKFPLAIHVMSEKVIINFSAMEGAESLLSYGIAGDVFKFIIAVALLLLTGWIMENKVNIK